MKSAVREIDSLLKLKSELKISYLPEDIKRHAQDTVKQGRYNQG